MFLAKELTNYNEITETKKDKMIFAFRCWHLEKESSLYFGQNTRQTKHLI